MKKITKILSVLVLLVFAVSSCASINGAGTAKVNEAPRLTEEELVENLGGAMGVFVATLLQASFGGADGKTLIFDMNKPDTLTYNDFAVGPIKAKMKEEGLDIPFDYVTGTIVYKGSLMGSEGITDIKMDLKLRPGVVKTFVADLHMGKDKNGKDLITGSLNINGQVYGNVNEIIKKFKDKAEAEKKNK